MTKEQFLIKWPYLNEIRDTINPYFIEDIDAVIAYEIEKAKGEVKPAPNPIREAYDNFQPIRFKGWLKYEWVKKHSELESITDVGNISDYEWNFDTKPEDWEIYTEAEAEQVTAPAKPKFDQDRFERMFRAVVASGRTESYDQDFLATNICLEKLDAYYATKKGGSND
jgi:hypothetical protein